jgi:hypothetical protein
MVQCFACLVDQMCASFAKHSPMSACLTNIVIVHHVWTIKESYDSVQGGDS